MAAASSAVSVTTLAPVYDTLIQLKQRIPVAPARPTGPQQLPTVGGAGNLQVLGATEPAVEALERACAEGAAALLTGPDAHRIPQRCFARSAGACHTGAQYRGRTYRIAQRQR